MRTQDTLIKLPHQISGRSNSNNFCISELLIVFAFGFGSLLLATGSLFGNARGVYAIGNPIFLGVMNVLCLYIFVSNVYADKLKAFRGFSIWITIFFVLMFIRLMVDIFIDPVGEQLPNEKKLLLTCIFKHFIPGLYFALPIVCSEKKNIFRFFYVQLVVTCAISLLSFTINNTEYSREQRLVYPGTPQMSALLVCCTIWIWKCERIRLLPTLFFVCLGSVGLTLTGQRGPFLACFAVLLSLMFMTSLWKKKGISLVLLTIVLSSTFTMVFGNGRLLKKMERVYVRTISSIKIYDNVSREKYVTVETVIEMPIEVSENLPDSPQISDFSPDRVSENAEPEIAKPERAKSERAKPEMTKSEVAKSEVAKSEAAKSEAAKPEMTKPEIAKPKETNPEETSVVKHTIRKKVAKKKSLSEMCYDYAKKSKDPRLTIYFKSIGDILERPFMGSPPINLVKKTQRYAHNSILDAFLTTGIFGGCIFLIVIFQGFCNARLVFREMPELALFAVLFLFYFFNSLVSFTIYAYMPFWLSLIALHATATTIRAKMNDLSLPDKDVTECDA